MFFLTGGWFPIPAFPLMRNGFSERTGAVKVAPIGAAKRILDGEDRSEKKGQERERVGRRLRVDF